MSAASAPPPDAARPGPLQTFVDELGAALLVVVGAVVVEHLAVGFGQRAQFAGTWEMGVARTHVTPVLLAALLPVLAGLVFVLRGAEARATRGLAALGAAAGLAVGLGTSHGRHFAASPLRAAYVVGVAAVAAAATTHLLPRVAALPARRRAPLGLALAAGAVAADVLVLPRLYPAAHDALFALALLGLVVASRGLAGWPRPVVGRALVGVALASWAWAPAAARGLRVHDNLRLVLLEHAPGLGRAVALAARLAPPEADDEGAAAAGEATLSGAPAGEGARPLDWSGRDVLLVTVDALRADRLGAYGYPRPTTPHLDALARRGARFDAAYCPTPHTSYSVTSLMTGKYMRPLLGQGLGEDSETWALGLRRYGYRTAAFYPPAVFFIDEERFTRFRDDGLGFEYRKVEFATPEVRTAQLAAYLGRRPKAPGSPPLFLWVHVFEPHEPYEAHPEHRFTGGRGDEDAYDGEVAAADAIVGGVVAQVEAARPGVVVLVTADHGEELGDHGGRYHGTTVYDEQVRVPLVVVGPGVAPGVVKEPVQTIDLLPTVLGALGMPRSPKLRGRDLGALLRDPAGARGPGFAYAEADDLRLVAEGSERLVCARRVGACRLYDVATDPREERPVTDRPARVAALRARAAAVERAHGRHEGAGADLPEALRRGASGDRDAAVDVAQLLDDARVDVRRRAAEILVDLRAEDVAPQLRRAERVDESPEVRALAALALVRLGAPIAEHPDAPGALASPDPALRVLAARVLAERGDARGEGELVAALDDPRGADLAVVAAWVDVLGDLRAAAAVPALVRKLGDVRLRPRVARALGRIGAPAARAPLLAALEVERYHHARAAEIEALLALGVRAELAPSITRLAGVPEPLPEAASAARALGLAAPVPGTLAVAAAPRGLQVLVERAGAEAPADAGGAPSPTPTAIRVDGERVLLLPLPGGRVLVGTTDAPRGAGPVRLAPDGPDGPKVTGAFVVARVDDLPPPPKEAWDGGGSHEEDDPDDGGAAPAGAANPR